MVRARLVAAVVVCALFVGWAASPFVSELVAAFR
jgi:hypothetical protein